MYKPVDWRNIANYPDPQKGAVHLGAWVWEFVRRNPEFQKMFDEFARPFWTEWLIANQKFISAEKWDVREYTNSPAALASLRIPLDDWRIARFGLAPTIGRPETPSAFVPESRSFLPPTLFAGMSPEFVFCNDDWVDRDDMTDDTLESSNDHRAAWVKIDFRRPLAPQVEGIERWAKDHQKKLVNGGMLSPKIFKPRNKKFIEYLRVLDAKDSGAKQGEIARVLFPSKPNRYNDKQGDKAVENAFRAAKKMRDGGWRELLTY